MVDHREIVCDSSIFGCILPPKKRTEAHKTSTKNASSSFPPDGDNASELPLANQELSDWFWYVLSFDQEALCAQSAALTAAAHNKIKQLSYNEKVNFSVVLPYTWC